MRAAVLHAFHKPLVVEDVDVESPKAGEVLERFNSVHLLQDGKWLKEVPTYRGRGHAFL